MLESHISKKKKKTFVQTGDFDALKSSRDHNKLG